MTRWFKRLFLTVLFLALGYVVAVQVLRWIAFGEEEREALAVMTVQAPLPEGPSGFKYLAYAHKQVPDDALDEVLAADIAAFAEWHADSGTRVWAGEQGPYEPPATPGADRYPDLPESAMPAVACSFQQDDCLAHLRGHEAEARAWLDAEAARIRRVEQALASPHLANPYPPNVAAPLPPYQQLRLPLNDIALQALEGDIAGALPRACGLLADARKHLRSNGYLIDKTVFAALVDGASDLLLRLRQADPTLPLPAACDDATAPVVLDDYQVCGALRAEFSLMAEYSRQMHESSGGWRLPTRWVLHDQRLQDGWIAMGLAPYCTPEGQSLIARGELPEVPNEEFSRTSVDFWAAPISRILSQIAPPAYGNYQKRLLDHATRTGSNLEAISSFAAETTGATSTTRSPTA